MRILPVHPEVLAYVNSRNLGKKFQKQTRLLAENLRHPSLRVELLEPRHLRIYSFRIGCKYRGIFIFRDPLNIEILDGNDHYQ